MLRAALDRLRISYLPEVSTGVWDALVAEAEHGEGVTLRVLGESAHVKCHRAGDAITLDGDAFWCRIRRPGARKQRSECRVAAVEVECRGLGCAATATGLESIRSVREAVEALLYPEWSRVDLAPRTLPGRFDPCVDVNVRGAGAAAWKEKVLFRGGHLDRIRADFCSRALEPDTMRPDEDSQMRLNGSEARGRTFYLGLLCLYDKGAMTNDGKRVLERTLRAMGWDGQGELLRCELRPTRAWLRDQVFTLASGQQVRGDRLTLDEFLAPGVLTEVFTALFHRYRHCGRPAPRDHKVKRENSAFWNAACAGIGRLRDDGGSKVVSSIKSVKRERALARAVDAAANAILDAAVVTGSVAAAHGQVILRISELCRTPQRQQRDARLRRRYGDPRPTVLAAAVAPEPIVHVPSEPIRA